VTRPQCVPATAAPACHSHTCDMSHKKVRSQCSVSGTARSALETHVLASPLPDPPNTQAHTAAQSKPLGAKQTPHTCGGTRPACTASARRRPSTAPAACPAAQSRGGGRGRCSRAHAPGTFRCGWHGRSGQCVGVGMQCQLQQSLATPASCGVVRVSASKDCHSPVGLPLKAIQAAADRRG
jgi:hypothetical protein